MLFIVDALNKDKYLPLVEEMYRLRARVFNDRLGWEVSVEHGMEIDEFDYLDPAYVIGLNHAGDVVSCVRALQTTGPHMLSDVFYDILDGQPPLRSATLWESTRFCVDTARLSDRSDSVSHAMCEIMIGSLEFAMNSGIEDIITVIDPIIDRLLKRTDNAPYDYVGHKVRFGKTHALAALLDCTPERINRVRDFAGIHNDVFLTDAQVDYLMSVKTAKQRTSMPELMKMAG